MLTTCSRHVHNLLTTCSRHVHDMFTTCSGHVHGMFMTCSWHVCVMFTTYSREKVEHNSYKDRLNDYFKNLLHFHWTLIVLVYIGHKVGFFFFSQIDQRLANREKSQNCATIVRGAVNYLTPFKVTAK